MIYQGIIKYNKIFFKIKISEWRNLEKTKMFMLISIAIQNSGWKRIQGNNFFSINIVIF